MREQIKKIDYEMQETTDRLSDLFEEEKEKITNEYNNLRKLKNEKQSLENKIKGLEMAIEIIKKEN